MKKNIFKSGGFQSLLASLLCIVLGLFLGYLVLLLINPAGAGEAILTVIKNFMTYNRPASQLKYFGNTLVKTRSLLFVSPRTSDTRSYTEATRPSARDAAARARTPP